MLSNRSTLITENGKDNKIELSFKERPDETDNQTKNEEVAQKKRKLVGVAGAAPKVGRTSRAKGKDVVETGSKHAQVTSEGKGVKQIDSTCLCSSKFARNGKKNQKEVSDRGWGPTKAWNQYKVDMKKWFQKRRGGGAPKGV